MKTCNVCMASLPATFDYFHRKAASRDGLVSSCKACVRAWHAQYYLENKEYYSQNSRAWRQANPKKWKQIKAKSIDKHRLTHNQTAAEWARRWWANHLAEGRANSVKRRHIRRAQEHEAFVEPVDRDVIFQRDQGLCHLCCTSVDPDDAHLDHIVPLSRGGKHSYANVGLAHSRCNLRKNSKLMSELILPFSA